MPRETYQRIPEALFTERMTSDELRRNFYANFPPELENRAPVSMYPDISGENADWRFSSFDEPSGEVHMVVPAEYSKEPNAISADRDIPLLDFYLLNPDKAPADLKLPLSMYFATWDKYSPSEQERFSDSESICEDTWDALSEDEQLSERKQHTLISISEAKEKIQALYTKLASQRTEPEPKADPRSQRFAEYDRLRRATVFGFAKN
jgi:hypothetical protein